MFSIATGSYHTCVIVTGGGVKCWGRNNYGQLGIGSSNTQYSPVNVGLGSGMDWPIVLISMTECT